MEAATTPNALMGLRERRRANLRLLAGRATSQKEFAESLGWSESQLSQIIGANPIRSVTENVAYHVEQTLGLATGWLDEDRSE